MAAHLSVATVIEKNKLTSDVAFVILMDVNITDPVSREVIEILRIARNDENVIFGGEVYQAGNFDISIEQRQSEDSTVSVVARDPTGFIQSRMEEVSGGVFSEAIISVVNTARLDEAPEVQERFQILSASSKDYVVSFSLGAENLLGLAYPPRRQFQDRCAWKYKGYGCQSTSLDPTCSYTKDGINGCASKNNAINFKGLPGLVTMNV